MVAFVIGGEVSSRYLPKVKMKHYLFNFRSDRGNCFLHCFVRVMDNNIADAAQDLYRITDNG